MLFNQIVQRSYTLTGLPRRNLFNPKDYEYLTDLVESTGFKKDNSDTNFDYLEKYLLNKENKTKKK